MIEIINYKEKQYEVTNPGEIIYSTTHYLRGCRIDKRFEIVDQLNGCSEIKYNNSDCSSRVKYLNTKYGLSELDYYIIVVCRGDESKLPKCTYVNPYTGEVCNKFRKFRTLTPGLFTKTGKRMGIFHDGCEDHTVNAAVQIAQRENYELGVTGLQKADRKSKVWREKHAKKQMAEGNSIFSPDDVRNENIPSWRDTQSNPSINYYSKIANSLGMDRYNLSVENCILIDKLNYIRKGNPNDTCIYYITFFVETNNYFKLGVTTDLDKRANSNRSYHGYSYKSSEILFVSDRLTIAEIEYKVKIKFKDFIVLGNEAFDINHKDEIIEYINELISYYKNEVQNS